MTNTSTRSPFFVLLAFVGVSSLASACKFPYKYKYEKETGVGLTDRANDYCRKASAKQGYKAVVTVGPLTMDSPSQVDVRMQVRDGGGELVLSCQFDDQKRIASIPNPMRGNSKTLGYSSSDAKQARSVCERAVRGSGYTIGTVGAGEWTGSRQYRVNVLVRQGGADHTVACRYDGVPATASVPPVSK